mgnify:CR=1 FL=1
MWGFFWLVGTNKRKYAPSHHEALGEVLKGERRRVHATLHLAPLERERQQVARARRRRLGEHARYDEPSGGEEGRELVRLDETVRDVRDADEALEAARERDEDALHRGRLDVASDEVA